ncbi:MAG TPA: ribonuclease P protein component [Rhodanobacteraceae bacterium]
MAGLPPTARLRRAADFAALRHATGRFQAQHFALRWIVSPKGFARMGLAVSRKVSKRAVERNRIKRLLRESFRVQREALPPLDILVIARTSAAATDSSMLRADIERAWHRLQALKPPSAPATIGG